MVQDITKKIICSGNPKAQSVANGVQVHLPDTQFIHTTNGYDLRLWDDERRQIFVDLIKNSNVFINASKICQLGQLQLLNLAHETVVSNKMLDYTIINVGSIAEYDPNKFEMYSIEKNALKERSRQLADKGFRSSHITIGNLDNVEGIGKTIKLILDSDPFISIIKIEH